MTAFSAEFYGIAMFGATLLLYIVIDVTVEAIRRRRAK